MKKLFLLALISTNVYAIDCDKNSIACKIVENKAKRNESIENTSAIKISAQIALVSKKYKIPAQLFTAILMQESGYRLKAKRCKVTGYMKSRREIASEIYDIKPTSLIGSKEKCTDFGISQIHYKTVKRYGFSEFRLTTDLAYSVEAGAIVLKDFMKSFRHESDWYTRYNCGNGGTTDRQTCQTYKYLIAQYL